MPSNGRSLKEEEEREYAVELCRSNLTFIIE
jgi:hypothetical protein